MQQPLQPIIENLETCFDGQPWYGVSLMKILETVSWERVNAKNYGDKSIAMLVRHILNWRIFVLKKLQGDADYTIEMDSTSDWTQIYLKSQEEWETLKQELRANQTEIVSLLKTADGTLLTNQVPGKDYTFAPILTSIAQHDIYHLGQIAMLNSELNS